MLTPEDLDALRKLTKWEAVALQCLFIALFVAHLVYGLNTADPETWLHSAIGFVPVGIVGALAWRAAQLADMAKKLHIETREDTNADL